MKNGAATSPVEGHWTVLEPQADFLGLDRPLALPGKHPFYLPYEPPDLEPRKLEAGQDMVRFMLMALFVVLSFMAALVVAFLAALVIMVPEAFAEERSPLDTPLSIRVRAEGQSEAEFSGGGKVQTGSVRTDVAWSIFEGYFMRTGYAWSQTDSLPFATGADSPIDGINRMALGVSYGHAFAEGWSWFAMARATSSFEKEMDGSLGGAFRAGVGWDFAENWKLQLGAVLFVNNIDVTPLPLIRIQFNGVDESGSGFFGTLGVMELVAGYQFDESFRVSADFGMDTTTSRLANDSAIRKKGYLETRAYVTSLEAVWDFARGWQLRLGPQFRFGREWTVYDRDGKNKSRYDLGESVGGFLTLRYRF